MRSEARKVVLTDTSPTPMSGGNFNGVSWGADSHDCDASTENETANGYLSYGIRGASDDGADDNNYASSGHGNATAKAIGNSSSDGSSNNGTPKVLVSISLHFIWPERPNKAVC